MKKTLVNAAMAARDLCIDSYGNAFDGQTERSMRYSMLAVRQLGYLIDALANSPNKTRSFFLEDETRMLRERSNPDYHLFPEYDPTLTAAAAQRWAERDLPDLLNYLGPNGAPEWGHVIAFPRRKR